MADETSLQAGRVRSHASDAINLAAGCAAAHLKFKENLPAVTECQSVANEYCGARFQPLKKKALLAGAEIALRVCMLPTKPAGQ